MRTGKKITALLLAAMLVAGTSALLATTASAEENVSAYSTSVEDEKTWEDYKYIVLADGTVEITGYTGSEGDLVIKSEIDGKRVTSIGNGAFDSLKSLKSVVIPEGVTAIKDEAFSSCTELKNVVLSNSVETIGEWAFWNCGKITDITIPDSVTSIEKNAFSVCESLVNINVNEGNQNYSSLDGVLFNKDKTLLILCPEAKKDSYEIPDSVTTIGSSAFSHCTDLTSVTIPDSVVTIEDYAFYCYLGSL